MSTEALCVAAVSTNPRQICRLESPALAREGSQLCPGHESKLFQTIGELNGAVSLLLALRTGGTNHGGEHVTGSKEPPLPFRVDMLDLADRIGDVTGSWALMVAEERSLQTPVGLPAAVRLLLAQFDWLVTQPWTADLYGELTDVHTQAHRLAPWRLGRRRLPVRHLVEFGGCGALAIFQDDGEDDGTCDSNAGGCGSRIAAVDLARWLGRDIAA
jgi:hypothetical protein